MCSSDSNLIEKLRKENLDQYFTLVRMHLSFIVEINADDIDSPTDKPKQFRWNFMKTKSSSNSSHNNINNGKICQTDIQSINEEGIGRVYELIDYLAKEDNVTQEGIFRRTGSLTRQQELRQLLLTGAELGLHDGKFSVHDCASVLKGFLAELPQPLLMDQYYQIYCNLASQYPPNTDPVEPKLLMALQLLLLLLTPLHRTFLEKLLRLLRMAADNEATNRMSPDTLATMFTPHLLCPRKLSPEVFHTDAVALAPLISFMIRRTEVLFEAPKQLLTDVAAYFTMRERKRMLSPNIDLDESITDRTAANTVYTFVDRHRTTAENETNPTDTALAQLYAHIQALPDSQHKRRLIKQFNRQNGYGTPIQVQRTGKTAGSRSFGDSIKKHIFNKGILNKTPKKGSATTINTIDEKNTAKEKICFTNDSRDVSHKNVVLKNLANKIANTETIDNEDDCLSDSSSNESTLSDGALNTSKKNSPKFISEPNLSLLESKTDETPKKKRGTRLFRSKVISAPVNKKYQKRGTTIRSTPTTCVSCFEDQGTTSENDSLPDCSEPITPNKTSSPKPNLDGSIERSIPMKSYITSTPGMVEKEVLDEDCSTPYTIHFRRASMSPITKSTQKLPKAMQESIMTPRSRKPLIITSEQRELTESSQNKVNPSQNLSKNSEIYHTMSPNNDSDFVSSEDEDVESRTSIYSSEANKSNSSRHENTRFILTHERPKLPQDLNQTLLDYDAPPSILKTKSLSEPFREYLLSRSVLTATPVDLSILNKSSDNVDDKITDSLMYCLDGNVPSDLTSSINNLVVDKDCETRSPLKNINVKVTDSVLDPNRKRAATSKQEDAMIVEVKKAMKEKENVFDCDSEEFKLRETEL